MDDHAVALEVVDDEVLGQFIAGFAPGAAGRAMAVCRLPVLRRYLLDPHSRPPRTPRSEDLGPVGQELDAWGRWQREQGGISREVVGNRRHWVGGFVATLLEGSVLRWDTVGIEGVNAYVAERGKGYAPASCSLLVSAMRCLLRWALVTGRIDRDLGPGVLRARATRATLPRGLSPAQFEALLAATDPTTPVGARDRAVLITLARLGLRAGEAAGLVLDDIDWATGRLSVIGKHHRRLTLPLPEDVAHTIIAWLRVRPAAAGDRAVFVRLRAPISRLTSAGISSIVAHAAQRADLGVMHAHRLRHTAATNVLAAGGSLVEAQELLGHAHRDSTRVYARTDLISLRTLAVPFGRLP
ncbi:tyrosine-type recombinase/integrase [Ornithinimicrobium murale]|uniref:tyrosine-type recombinase/integrase n=1 Tax=Ornithinimicrobium murale TaxID=1050153 RepID=UPI0013B39169|nr:tyrosine-type recombinase/integrase [Ornithinimicrobium murale]